MFKRVLWTFVLDNRRTAHNNQGPSPQMPRQTPQGDSRQCDTTIARYPAISVQ